MAAAAAGWMLGAGSSALAVPVTFQVDMGIQAALGRFDAVAHTVEVHGSFDGWGNGATLAADPVNADLYTVTLDVAGTPGTVVQYKFVINQGGGTLVWEDNGVGPDGAQNRECTLPESGLVLPAVHFNNQSTMPGTVLVTFQVNMAIQKILGNFDPAQHTMEVRGGFDGWGAGLVLNPSATEEDVYEGTVEITGSTGASYDYKFVINQAGTLVYEGNVGPGGVYGNRVSILSESPQVLPVVFFDNVDTDPGAGIPVTFQVDMAVEVARGNFDPDANTVFVAGPFNNWSTDATPLAARSPGSTVYTTTVRIKSSPGSTIGHKFVSSISSWEGGDNRTFTLESPEQTLPVVFFNRVDNLGTLTIGTPENGEVLISWTAGSRIRLQSAAGVGAPWEDVPDTEGQSPALVPCGDARRIFRLIGP